MFTDEVQKLSADVCLYFYAEGRIEPNYVSLLVLAAVLCGVNYRFLAFSVQLNSLYSLYSLRAVYSCAAVLAYGETILV